MAQDLKPGSRWVSAVCDTEVIVVKAGGDGLSLACGGHPMVASGSAKPGGASLDPGLSGGTPVGKRYQHESGRRILTLRVQRTEEVNGFDPSIWRR